MSLSVVILAAGAGTRMHSDLPKVLHCLAGKPLLAHVVEVAQQIDAQRIIIVYGHQGEQVRNALSHLPILWVEQTERLGTGHAVMQAIPQIPDGDDVLVLYGDVPLINAETLLRLIPLAKKDSLALVTCELPEPFGYGRIIRDDVGHVRCIVEEKDASVSEKQICEVNTGIMAAPRKRLDAWLSKLKNNNSQNEYYLTDIIGMAVNDGIKVETIAPRNIAEISGVNNRKQLAELERHYQRTNAEALMLRGLTLSDPARFDQRGTFDFGRDVAIDVNVIIEGHVRCGKRVHIGPNTFIRNSIIGDDIEILPNCVIDGAEIGANSRIGPFARIRPETKTGNHAHIGNFVELKKSIIGAHTNINHLSYIGDSNIGSKVNIGAGTITCNYDGANKHQTVIEDGVFIGSDTQLIAPVKVGKDATIGAGSTITRDVAAGQLTLSRVPQKTIEGWQRPQKKKN